MKQYLLTVLFNAPTTMSKGIYHCPARIIPKPL
jgi:hypothetical protein